MATIDLAALTLGDVSVSGKGAKSCQFTAHGLQVLVHFEAMSIAFEPSAYNDPDATRVNMVFRPTAEVIDTLTQLDEWILQAVCKDPPKYFGKQRSSDQIRESYTPIVKTSEKYEPSFMPCHALHCMACIVIIIIYFYFMN